MSHTYEIVSGRWYDPTDELIGVGYSGGGGGENPGAVNNPAFTSVKGVGPLPPGQYTMQLIVDEQGDASDYEGKKAPVFRLLPDPANVMYGRDGLLIHGDNAQMNKSASDGCIIQAHDVRVQIQNSLDHNLNVVAQLSEEES